MMETQYNTTDKINAIVDDDRFNADTNARVCDHNKAQLMLYAGYEDQQREIIRDEFGLKIESQERGAASGNTVTVVVDPDGDDPNDVDVEMDPSDAIEMF